MSSLRSKFFYQLAVSFLYSIAPIAVFPYITRTLGPENLGKINFIDYAAQFFLLFAAFGIPLYGVREISKRRNNKSAVEELTSEFLLLHFLFSLVSLAGFAGLVLLFPDDFGERSLLLFAAVNILANAFSTEWLLQGLEEFAFYSKRSFVIKLLSVAAVFIFVRHPADYVLYYVLLVLTNLCVLLADIIFIYKKGYRLQRPSGLKKHLLPLSIFFATSATISIYTFFDTVILGLISGSLAVGFYTTGLKTIRFTQNFINDIGSVLLPRLSFLVGQKEEKEIHRLMNLSLQYILTVSLPLLFFLFLLAPEIIRVLAGTAFLPSVPVLQILSGLPLLIGLSNLFGTQVLLAYGKERSVFAGVVLGSISSVAANVALCPLYQEQGAAIAAIIAELVVTLVLGWRAIRLVRFSVSKTFYLGLLFSCLFFIPVVWTVRQFSLPALLQVMVAGLGCFGLFTLFQLLVFKNLVVKTMLQFLQSFFPGGKTYI